MEEDRKSQQCPYGSSGWVSLSHGRAVEMGGEERGGEGRGGEGRG